MQKQLLENIFAYKKTVALLAAFQMKLFQKIKEYGCMNKEICRQLKWNERYIELLCIYLTNEKFLSKVDNGWQITKEFEKEMYSFEKICEHESSLYHKWLSPEQLASSVQNLSNYRLFDFTPEEQYAYDNAMYGSNINLIAFHLLRKIKFGNTSPVYCLEYGRSNGRIGQVLKKYSSKINVDVVSIDKVVERQSSYDVILIYNTIHYKTPEEWKMIFAKMEKTLNQSGVICIADIFYKEKNMFQSTVLLDWITHGGVYNIYSCEVAEQLQAIGFTKVEQKTIESIFTDLFFAYK